MKTWTAATAALIAMALSGAPDMSVSQPRVAPTYHASAIEVAKLPKYCWAQYVDGAYFGHPVYSIPDSCGPYTNHFCPALVLLDRASQATSPRHKRREDLRRAANEVKYTLNYIKPSCPIYPDVKGAQMRVEVLQKLIK